MKVIRNNILVKPMPADEKSEGGIIVPENMRKPSNKVEVVSVGAWVKDFRPGQIAFRIKDSGDEYIEDGQQYFIVNEAWLLATLN